MGRGCCPSQEPHPRSWPSALQSCPKIKILGTPLALAWKDRTKNNRWTHQSDPRLEGADIENADVSQRQDSEVQVDGRATHASTQ